MVDMMNDARTEKQGDDPIDITNEHDSDEPKNLVGYNKESIILRFFKSESIRGWFMIVITGLLACVAFYQWSAMNANLEEARKLTKAADVQAVATQKAADSAKASAHAAEDNAKISEKLSKITYQQLILSAEPNIDLESANWDNQHNQLYNQLKDGKLKFELRNLSPVNLKNVRFYSEILYTLDCD